MPVDIGQELYEQIKAELDKLTAADGFIKAVAGRISAGTATMEDVSLYAQQLGVRLRQVLGDKIRADVLPNGQMYYNIAEKILDPILHDNYDLVNQTASDVQRILDKRHNINIKPQKAAFPYDRVQAICNAAKDQEAARAAEIMGRASDTVSRSFADDYMEENAKFRSKAGFQTYIVRATDGKCCDWCSRQAGKYSYPDATPHEVFQRHDNCGCTVTYENGEMRQDVWSKRTWQASPEELAERKDLEEKNKPVRFSPEEAAAKEKEQLDKQPKINNMSLDNGSESGILEERRVSARNVDTGGRRNEIPLSAEEVEQIKDYASELGMPIERIRYGDHYNTSYGSNFDMLYIGTDALPSQQPQSANSRLSWKCTVAHEIVGHREACLKGWAQSIELYDEIQASIRAARFSPSLSNVERINLLRDASERAHENGLRLKDVKNSLYISER